MKKTIAVDIDDVLAANAESFAAFSNKRWGTNLKPDDYSEHWAEMWNIDIKHAQRRREVIIKEKLFTSYRFFDEAKIILKRLKERYKLVIVSSRSLEIQKETLDWLETEFKGIFSEIHFAKIWDDPNLNVLKKLELTKTEICREIGADYLVDDQPKHCIAAANAGIEALLFGEYGWNKDSSLPNGVTRVKNWLEVEKFFDGKTE